MSILEISPINFERPSMMIREGEGCTTEMVWSAIEFESDRVDAFGQSKFDAVRVHLKGGEVWLFSNVWIAPRSKFGGAFVMIYGSVRMERSAYSEIVPEHTPHSFTKSGPRMF